LISGNAAALAGHYLKNFSVLPVSQGVVDILSPSGRLVALGIVELA
jgi:hypothetical protein